eukprot:6670661-Pyramimonas_sp.AAC.1
MRVKLIIGRPPPDATNWGVRGRLVEGSRRCARTLPLSCSAPITGGLGAVRVIHAVYYQLSRRSANKRVVIVNKGMGRVGGARGLRLGRTRGESLNLRRQWVPGGASITAAGACRRERRAYASGPRIENMHV